MYSQLGNIIFSGLNGFDTLEKNRETDYAEHALIDGKPRLQRIGEKLETINISINLHSLFTDPQAQINALDTARENGEVLPLLNGAGDYKGNFVIRRIAESTRELAPDGSLVWVVVNLELCEYYEANPLNARAQNAKLAALALAGVSENPATIAPLKPVAVTLATPSAAVINSVSVIATEAAQVAKDLQSAAVNPTAAERLYNKAVAGIAKLKEGVDQVNKKITEMQNANTRYINLRDQATNVKEKAEVLEAFVNARSLNDIGNANIDLVNEVSRMQNASAPIALDIALRR